MPSGGCLKDPISESKRRQKISDAKKGCAFTDAHKQALRDAHVGFTGRTHSIAARKKIGDAFTGKHLSVQHRDKLSTIHKTIPISDITRQKLYESRIGKPLTDTCRENLSLSITEAKARGFWYGNVRYSSRLQYCELWKDVNPRVHAWFNYRCCLCGAPENGKSHIGHHVFYVKKACCWHTDDGVYYTNLNATDHIEHDYWIGENPNYFVILCHTCHGKTNGNFANRKKWADFFRKMIDEQYGGKCYLTKDEMAAYQP